jgi:hypothetical protein
MAMAKPPKNRIAQMVTKTMTIQSSALSPLFWFRAPRASSS